MRNDTVHNASESISYRGDTLWSYLGLKIWEMLPSEMQECETLFEFKSKVKSWKPINCPRKLCKTYIGGVQWMEQYAPCDKPYESI